MAFVVGINVAISLRLLGIGAAQAEQSYLRFLPLHWIACVCILISGIALLIAYPAKALSNPVFYVKLVALGFGLNITANLQLGWQLGKELANPRTVACFSLACWAITISAGRFLAYTHSVLLASRFF